MLHPNFPILLRHQRLWTAFYLHIGYQFGTEDCDGGHLWRHVPILHWSSPEQPWHHHRIKLHGLPLIKVRQQFKRKPKQTMPGLQHKCGENNLPLFGLRCLRTRLRPPLPLDEQVHRRWQSLCILCFSRHDTHILDLLLRCFWHRHDGNRYAKCC